MGEHATDRAQDQSRLTEIPGSENMHERVWKIRGADRAFPLDVIGLKRRHTGNEEAI